MTERLFNRFEIKYRINQSQCEIAKALFKDLIKRDLNGEYLVHSVYFDSPQYVFYSEKIEGLSVRVKPRLRIYHSATNGKPLGFYFELKHRFGKQIKKERVKITENQALDILRGNIPEIDSPVVRKLDYLFCKFNLKPTVSILYKREAYFCPFFNNLRLTFDSNIRSTLSVVSLNSPFNAPYVIDPREFIVELKYNGNLPRIILDYIKRLKWTQIALSKYVFAMEEQFSRVESRFQNLPMPSELPCIR